MDNEKIAKNLTQLADLLEFTGANAFRLRAYRNGARKIKDLTTPIKTLIANGDDLTKLDGIGKGVAEKCIELCQTGKLEQMETLFDTVPRTVLDLLNVPKMGPKKAAALFNELNIQDLDQLKAACEEGVVSQLSGFGKKTEQAILDGIAIAVAANQRILWAAADKIVQRLRRYMQSSSGVDRLEFAGSYRRGKETVGDLDMLVTSNDVGAVMDHFEHFEDVTSTIVRGETKMSVRLEDEFQVDLRVVPDESFGAALQYFTGSKDHNVRVRGLAKQKGLKINEWGVYRIDSDDGDESASIAGKDEDGVYQTLGLPCFEPELREARKEFDWAGDDSMPTLVTVEDIQGDLHMHTTASDGKDSIETMANAARVIGLKYIAITDHSKRVTMANGLDGKRLLQQWAQIDEINANSDDDFVILKGVECDILEGGGMDIEDDVLAQADWVIASVHYGQNQPMAQITDRIIGAIENTNISMVAHPTGRLLNKREAYQVDLQTVFAAAKEHRTLLELNANPVRLDLNDVYLMAAKEQGIPIVINTDAHRVLGLENMKYGIKQARRGGLEAGDVANTRTLGELKKLIGK